MKKPTPPRNKSPAQLPVDTAFKRMKTLQEQGRYQESLYLALQIASAFPGVINAWSSASVNCIHLARWQDAIGYVQAALKYGGNTLQFNKY